MSRGYQINVERGFDSLVEQSPHATLLGLINALDKRLEALLTEPKAATIKILPNAIPLRPVEPKVRPALHPPESMIRPPRSYTQQQKIAAEARRKAETTQLDARLGRLPLFSKPSDGITYNIPIQPRQHEELPVPLQAVKAVRLIVPLLYPLEQCRVELQGVSRDAAAKTERNFESKAIENPEINLMGHINYLAQHMHTFATRPEPETSTELRKPENEPQQIDKITKADQSVGSKPTVLSEAGEDRSHIKIIPRPPEWTNAREVRGSDDSDYSDSYDSGDETTDDEDHKDIASTLEPVAEGPERGLSLSFPQLELYGIELLELISLYITVKCERCKDMMDINNIRPAAGARSESCKKCASVLTVGFRKELMHANSVRAGYVDLDGCIVVDMLPR